jgi:hypothetical protein
MRDKSSSKRARSPAESTVVSSSVAESAIAAARAPGFFFDEGDAPQMAAITASRAVQPRR